MFRKSRPSTDSSEKVNRETLSRYRSFRIEGIVADLSIKKGRLSNGPKEASSESSAETNRNRTRLALAYATRLPTRNRFAGKQSTAAQSERPRSETSHIGEPKYGKGTGGAGPDQCNEKPRPANHHLAREKDSLETSTAGDTRHQTVALCLAPGLAVVSDQQSLARSLRARGASLRTNHLPEKACAGCQTGYGLNISRRRFFLSSLYPSSAVAFFKLRTNAVPRF